jgi:hypothetical protein
MSKVVDGKYIGWEFTHAPDLEPIISLIEAILGQSIDDYFCFRRRSAKGNHLLDVCETHLLTNIVQRLAFQIEGVDISQDANSGMRRVDQSWDSLRVVQNVLLQSNNGSYLT